MNVREAESSATQLLILNCLYQLMLLRGDTKIVALLSATLSLIIAWGVTYGVHRVTARKT